MKESKSCHTCQRQYYNLMTANCGHKICFHCVKYNKNTTKCSQCQTQANIRTRTPLHSPSRNVSNDPKERSTKIKDSQSKGIGETSPIMNGKKMSAAFNWQEDDSESGNIPVIKCKQHQEPLTMYCKSSRELICSICICNKAKLNNDVVPLRMAEEHLKKETKMHKEEARVYLGSIESAQKVIAKNTQYFELSYQGSLKALQNIFTEMREQIQTIEQRLRQQLNIFFDIKFKECTEISTDLSYLSSILHDYRQRDNIESCTFNELVYAFTSFKVIKGTLKGLNLDYVPYLKQIPIVQVNRYHYRDILNNYVTLKLDLPLKFGQKRRNKSQSSKSISKSKHEDWDRGGLHGVSKRDQKERSSVSRKHQMSLCCNVHGMEMGPQQKNLYKMLLKTKFKL